MRKFYILCDGGLGNRLGGLIGGLITAKILHCDPIICWPTNNWCGCEFTDLFDANLNVINLKSIDLFSANRDVCFMTHFHNNEYESTNIFGHSTEDLAIVKQKNNTVIYFNNKLPSYTQQHNIVEELKKIQIKNDILSLVRNYCRANMIDFKTYGIHIRLTDNPRKADIDSIFTLLSSSMKENYFVCSDDKDTELRFSTLPNVKINLKNNYVKKLVEGSWNENIIDNEGRSFNFNVDRNKDSVVEALVDMLILSRTNLSKLKNKSTFYIFAKYYSNFDIFQNK